MSTAFTYTTLKTAIKNHVEDQGTDFDSNIDTLIGLGEDRCLKDMDLEIWYAVDATIAIAQASPLVTLPTGCLRVGDFFYTSGTTRVFLEQRTYPYCVDYSPSTTAQSSPKYWAPYSETQVFLAGIPNASVTGTMKFLKRPNGIVSASATWLGTNAGDLLLCACLIASERFGMADERIPVWTAEYGTLLTSARNQFRHLWRQEYALAR